MRMLLLTLCFTSGCATMSIEAKVANLERRVTAIEKELKDVRHTQSDLRWRFKQASADIVQCSALYEGLEGIAEAMQDEEEALEKLSKNPGSSL